MKPRLARAPLTDVDVFIRRRVAWRIAPSILGAAEYRQRLVAADRRDADLMHAAQRMPWSCVCQVDDSEHVFVRSVLAAKARDPLWSSEWSQS